MPDSQRVSNKYQKLVLLLPDLRHPSNQSTDQLPQETPFLQQRNSVVLRIIPPNLRFSSRHTESCGLNNLTLRNPGQKERIDKDSLSKRNNSIMSTSNSNSEIQSISSSKNNSFNVLDQDTLADSSKSSIASSNSIQNLFSNANTVKKTFPNRGKKKQKQAKTHGNCSHCGPATTAEWRQGPYGLRTLCNSCGTYYNKLVNTIMSIYNLTRIDSTKKANLVMYFMKFKLKKTNRESRKAIKKIPYDDQWEKQVRNIVPFPLDEEFFVITDKSHDMNGVRKVRTRNSKPC